ncbi:pilus assembly protein PilZ [Luteimonas yindakuii]|uniref:flagellar brake protein n=1 Tax=Luteimonas yindakuii TaxID=2565782 RepID=UPI0011079441|nr:flagellar brake protein [Luteimonas yindakuii]QCU72555.1 pilus assembly protein PilZ [Luteimonas yindakuii]
MDPSFEHHPDQVDVAVDGTEQLRYEKREPADVRRLLGALVSARALVTAQIVPGSISCPTAVLAVDNDTVLLDGHPQEPINQRLLQAHHLVCTSQLDRVQIRFRVQRLQRVDNEGYTAFIAPLPASVIELQRRETYRLQIPPMQPVLCRLPADDGEDEGAELRVLDLSAGGVALAAAEGFALPGSSRLGGCTLLLPDAPPIVVELSVAHSYIEHTRNGSQRLRIGCRFEQLAPPAERAIQNYIFRVERQRSARERRAV